MLFNCIIIKLNKLIKLMNNPSNQGNPYQSINFNSYQPVNPSYHRSDINQDSSVNPANSSNQADTGSNYSSDSLLNNPYMQREFRLSYQQMIDRSNRFNIPYSNEGSPLNYLQGSDHGSRGENRQVPASLLDISPLNQYANLDRQANYDNQDRQPNFEYFPSGESRQSRLGHDALQARDQFTNPRRDSSLSQISSQQSGYIGSIPSIEENIRQAQQIIDLHEQTARRVQTQNQRRERQPWI